MSRAYQLLLFTNLNKTCTRIAARKCISGMCTIMGVSTSDRSGISAEKSVNKTSLDGRKSTLQGAITALLYFDHFFCENLNCLFHM